MVLFARAPDFRRITLAARTDEQGQPITDVTLAPDGRHVVFTTGQPRGEMTFNPASLVDAPAATLWLQSTAAGRKPSRSAPAPIPASRSTDAPCCSSTPATSWRSAPLRPPPSRSSSPRAAAAGRSSSGPRPATSSSSTTAAAIPSSAAFTPGQRRRLARHRRRPPRRPGPLAQWRATRLPPPARPQAQHDARPDRGRALLDQRRRPQDRGDP